MLSSTLYCWTARVVSRLQLLYGKGDEYWLHASND